MEWTAPTYAEIKMDAEIGSYQEDHQDRHETPECPFVGTGSESVEAAVAG
ncbi:MAG: hypothetical protein ACRENE_19270 [Polyangiaceae bacterium]